MIDHIDHIVLTTRDLPACERFYCEILGMDKETFAKGRIAFKFGAQKINVHEWGREFTPRAHVAAPGTLDLCFISAVPLKSVMEKLGQNKVEILEGPVAKTGALGPMQSVYCRDPDLNLVEISVYDK